MTPKDLLIQEIDTIPDPLINEVLDFLCFLKAKYHSSQGASTEPNTAVPPTPQPLKPFPQDYVLQGQQPYRYDDPFAPAVPLEEWDVLP